MFTTVLCHIYFLILILIVWKLRALIVSVFIYSCHLHKTSAAQQSVVVVVCLLFTACYMLSIGETSDQPIISI